MSPLVQLLRITAPLARSLRRPVHSVLRETDLQVSLGAKDFAFYDDALLLDKRDIFTHSAVNLGRDNGNDLLSTPNGLHVREMTVSAQRYSGRPISDHMSALA